MPSKTEPKGLIAVLHIIEDGLLIVLLLSMVIIAVLQIILRNFFSSGILWGDGFVRVLVLWIGLLGAMIASRRNHHISIDVISRYLPSSLKRLSGLITSVFTTAICSTMTIFSLKFVLDEKQSGITAFAKVPAWICESIIPIAFGIISVRYLILSIQTFIQLIKQRSEK